MWDIEELTANSFNPLLYLEAGYLNVSYFPEFGQ